MTPTQWEVLWDLYVNKQLQRAMKNTIATFDVQFKHPAAHFCQPVALWTRTAAYECNAGVGRGRGFLSRGG